MSQPLEPSSEYGYESMPPPPEGYGTGPVSALTAPTQLQRAAQCLYGLAGIQIVGFALSLLTIDAARDTFRESDSTLTESQVNTAVTVGLVFSAILSLAFAGLWLLCGRKMLVGKTWARLVATILTGLIIMLNALTLTAGGGPDGVRDALSLLITVVGLILSIAVIVLAWSKPSSAYFADVQRRT